MEIPINEIVTGRKCFFILPDLSLMPVTYLEDFFSLGYECYYIGNDGRVPIQKKIDSILTLFKDVIIFINIDYDVPGLQWKDYLEELLYKKASKEQFGIIFLKRQSVTEMATIEKQYFKYLGLQRGYIQLEYKKQTNFELIARALYNNQAQGRRKTIRALCTSACTYKFTYGNENTPISGSLQDISLSHFSILVSDQPLPVKIYEKVNDIHFNIRGSFFHSDAILVMERPVGEKMLYVFAFVTSTGANGLDARTKTILTPVLYNMISSNCMGLLEQQYRKEETKKEEEKQQTEE
ncbi:MAG: hypothetical protein J6X78_13665 [Treponema sp.]|nr:hypothetical protein [Treponema sp.]